MYEPGDQRFKHIETAAAFYAARSSTGSRRTEA